MRKDTNCFQITANPLRPVIQALQLSWKVLKITSLSAFHVLQRLGCRFEHCHPLIGLDGTHLKSKYQGILLAATGVDANGSLYPLTYAVVDAENDDNWLW